MYVCMCMCVCVYVFVCVCVCLCVCSVTTRDLTVNQGRAQELYTLLWANTQIFMAIFLPVQ